MTRVTVAGNTTDANGGGISSGGSVTIRDSDITGNTAGAGGTGRGGGIASGAVSNLNISQGTVIKDNSAAS